MGNAIQDMLSKFAFPVYLAPMEGVTDRSFRLVCKKMGADVLVSEFISSDALSREIDKSVRKMCFDERERPFGVQIFGHDEQSLVAAARMAELAGPDFIDINWGCPVKKVVNKGAGSAILQDVPRMARLTAAVVDAVRLPVTVKTRLGWDSSSKPIVEVAERMQDAGVQAIAIHGRTRAQMYGGEADWSLIGEAKANPRLHIPVVGNGDIDSAEKALQYRKRYGVDAVMIGRAAIGNPWIFQQIKALVRGSEASFPTYDERVATVMEQLHLAAKEKGERRAVLEMRTQYAGYFKGLYNFKTVRMKLMQALTISECEDILRSYSEC
ncbi:MAG: tRNA dihydrouridine synthase DusB [Bacteroidales bacterium]|nr:tRNA dihydrouridine synthase DusB [Bacteroidales bacterium]